MLITCTCTLVPYVFIIDFCYSIHNVHVQFLILMRFRFFSFFYLPIPLYMYMSLHEGYSTPILHGLCSFGHATRHVMQQYCDNNAEMIKCIKARFSKPVIPGDTLQTDMWREGNIIFFRCKVSTIALTFSSNMYIM